MEIFAKKKCVIFWSWINSVLWTFLINSAEDMLKIAVTNSPVLCLASSWFYPVAVCSFLSYKSIIFCSQWWLRSLCLQKWMVIMFFNPNYNCRAISAVQRGPSVCLYCWGRAEPEAKLRGCVQSAGRIDAGFSLSWLFLHCHKEGEKEDSRERVAWKGSKCTVCLCFLQQWPVGRVCLCVWHRWWSWRGSVFIDALFPLPVSAERTPLSWLQVLPQGSSREGNGEKLSAFQNSVS